MTRKIVLAIPNRAYAAGLAAYLRETEPSWETSAFTHEAALRHRLQDPGGIDALIGDPGLLKQAESWLAGVPRITALVEEHGQTDGAWPEIMIYQPLPGVAASIRGLLADTAPVARGHCRLLTVFSAAGGIGKTTMALNITRLAGERGLRTLYLNLEPINATSKLFGVYEPDSLSRLLYVLQTEPEAFPGQLERSVRHQAYLRADIIDAPDHPGERLGMAPELLDRLIDSIRATGRYDLIVADPDSGISPWHAMLLGLSDKVAWLVTDDWQCMEKTVRLIAYWREEGADWGKRISFLRNKSQGASFGGWPLPAPPAAVLPYVPQWKEAEDPAKVFGSAAYCGVLEKLLDAWG